ncbi:RNA polymerase-associated protein RapA [Ectothiorhodospiraceae bacterium BW-2]|nr:RNA polymerase-associated protein RapA [Ectothiorhodospiraceae bacterium BW-2]
MSQEFTPGQRWICDTELQLGLGTVVECEPRRVTLRFDSCDETRSYARDNSPLTRIIFSPGDSIKTTTGEQLQVDEVMQLHGLVIYSAMSLDGTGVNVLESDLDHRLQLNRPADRLFSGQLDNQKWVSLRYQSWQQLQQLRRSPLWGLSGVRTALIPHQLYIAYEVGRRYQPRVLLADEVGLGKTIEAGLIIHQKYLSGQASRILIVVPEPLLHQWLVEMVRRFNLNLTLLDEERCQQLDSEGDNPFLSQQLVLSGQSFLSHSVERRQQALQAQWDLLVVDEAHHLQWSEDEVSDDYLAIEELARTIPAVLLLTATPEQFGRESHFSRLRLLDPDRFCSFSDFIEQEQSYAPIADAVEQLLTQAPLTAELEQLIRNTGIEGDNLTALQQLQSEESSVQQQARTELIDHLLDRHGTGRILFRNSRERISGFPERQLVAHPLPLPEQYRQPLDDYLCALIPDELTPDSAQFHPLLYPEQLWQHDSEQSDGWTRFDPRISWLIEQLQQQRQEKIVAITATAQSAIDIAHALRHRANLTTALFHEQMTLLERDRAAAWFADREQGCQLLICSEIGSEGRNFQFAHQLVLFDLPLNPDLLEQRIGRLDRIGQTRPVTIHLPYLEGSLQQLLYHWYHQGLNAFEQTATTAQSLQQRFWPQLRQSIITLHLDESLLQQLQQADATLRQQLRQGRNRLLEFNSCRPHIANRLVADAEQLQQDRPLTHWLDQLFHLIGVDAEPHSAFSTILRPTEQFLGDFMPDLTSDGLTMTTHRATALANESLHFFSWEHPMVQEALESLLSSERGNASLATFKEPRFEPGTLLLECWYRLEPAGHHAGELSRYLPPQLLRQVIDDNLQEWSSSLPFEELQPLLQPVKRDIARQVIERSRPVLQQLLKQSGELAEAQRPQRLATAQQLAETALQQEIDRLQALAQINGQVRLEELTHLQQQRQRLEQLLTLATLQLDSVRVLVVVD